MKLSSKLLGCAAIFAAAIGFASTANADSIYTVKAGDTLSQISYTLQGNVAAVNSIAQTNGIKNVDLIFVGQKLNLTSDGEIREATQKEVQTQPEVATVQEAVQAPEKAPVQEATPAPAPEAAPAAGRQITVQATAYDGVSLGGVTATGNIIQSTSSKVIAVDPSVIPLGSTVYVPGYGTAMAWDTGGAIRGNIIDLNMSTAEAIQWGRQTVTVTVMN